MVTGAEFSAATLAVTRTLDLLKHCRELADKANDIETKELILEMRSELADTKSVLIDAKEEINSKRELITELERKIKQKESLTLVGSFYYKDADTDTIPFCPSCFEKDNQAIHLQISPMQTFGYYRCPACQ
ncbi:MAG: hypothetical protein RLZZ74_3843, partial [Cyanobacteriota bacterium]